jgi:hypothetical protein
MSSLRFTIQDYTSSALVSTVIDEPIGLDKVSLHIARDKDYHGFADMVDDSLGKLQFYGGAYTILKNAYFNHGIDAHLECLIEFACDDDGSYQTLYQGRFSMDSYSQSEGLDGCYAEVIIKNSYNLTVFRDRISHKVSLDSLATFDEYEDDCVTPYPPLTPYEGLGTQVALQPMTIRMVDYATIDTNPVGSQVYGISCTPDIPLYSGNFFNLAYPCFASPPSTYGGSDGGQGNPTGNEFNLYAYYKTVITPFTNIRSAELGDFPGGVGDQYNNCYVQDLTGANEIFTYKPDIPFVNNKIDIDIELSIAVFNGDSNSRTVIDPHIKIYLIKGLTWTDALAHLNIIYDLSANDGRGTDTHSSNIYPTISACVIDQPEFDTGNITSNFSPSGSIGGAAFQYSFHTKDMTGDGKGIIFHPGEKLWLLVQVDGHEASASPPNLINPQTVFFSGTYTYQNSYDPSAPYILTTTVDSSTITDIRTGTYVSGQPLSYIRISFDSQYQATPSPVYMVNEALSRTAEIITNGQFQVYSDYFGRSTSNPIPSLPQAALSDGDGSMTSITNGLLIRGYSPLQAYYMGIGQNFLRSRPNTETSYTLLLSDIPSPSNSYILSVTNLSGETIIVPTDSTGYNIGDEIIIEQSTKTGIVTIQGASGVTIASPNGSYKTSGWGSQILLTKIGNNSWIIASRASMFCSFKDIIDAMKNIHAVGFGIEDDPNRIGYQRIRVEPISHFYDSSSVMLTCDNVDNVKTTADASASIAEFEIGYSKWEAEEAQGLDEFLTKRIYRTTLNVLRTKISQLCKFVASGYAIETTRRKLGTTTTDWRYDKDLFVICLTAAASPYTVNPGLGLFENVGPVTTTYSSENGGLTNAARMISPNTIYNARIAPVRNALRWLKYIFQCYVVPALGTLTFMEGDGNYYATGELSTNPIEAGPVSENQTLMLSDVAGDPATIWKNEMVAFKYPLGYNQWATIYSNPYGLIAYTVKGGATQYGYLMELKYDLFEGIGEFKLKTAVV